jgi:hypothetical protein
MGERSGYDGRGIGAEYRAMGAVRNEPNADGGMPRNSSMASSTG